MARSLGFGSITRDYSPYSDSVSLRLPYSVNLATNNQSLTHYTKGTQSLQMNSKAPTACTHTVSGSISLPSLGFFSPFPHGTGSLSVNREYLVLEDGPPFFSQDNTCPDLLFANPRLNVFVYRAITFFRRTFQTVLLTFNLLQLDGLFHFRSPLLAESLFDFFSSGYLDVSVPQVCSTTLCIQIAVTS